MIDVHEQVRDLIFLAQDPFVKIFGANISHDIILTLIPHYFLQSYSGTTDITTRN